VSVLGKASLLAALKERNPSKRLYVSPILSSDQIGEASIDIRLGSEFVTIKRGNLGTIDPSNKDADVDRFRIHHRLKRGEPFHLHPNEMVLASTLEYFRLPDNIASYVTSRSKWGRLGLVIATAVAVHPGFSGTITLELVNHSNVPLVLYPGLKVAQMIFYSAKGAGQYRGEASTKVSAHTFDMKRDWQDDLQFWTPGDVK
jgi:dCTP deaminase